MRSQPVHNAIPRNKILVLFSGGQDSATVLAWACHHYKHVETVGFYYGQRHHVEMEARLNIRAQIKETFPQWQKKLGSDHILNMGDFGAIGHTAMTDDKPIETQADGLPNTFVPGRNLAFLVYAAALAHRLNIRVLGAGMCETDFSGYPDCRQETLERQMEAINFGMANSDTLGGEMHLETPLMALSKQSCWSLADDLGGEKLIDIIRVHSHSCYIGMREQLHEWGYGCGTCPACELRAKGWREYTSRPATV